MTQTMSSIVTDVSATLGGHHKSSALRTQRPQTPLPAARLKLGASPDSSVRYVRQPCISKRSIPSKVRKSTAHMKQAGSKENEDLLRRGQGLREGAGHSAFFPCRPVAEAIEPCKSPHQATYFRCARGGKMRTALAMAPAPLPELLSCAEKEAQSCCCQEKGVLLILQNLEALSYIDYTSTETQRYHWKPPVCRVCGTPEPPSSHS